MDYVDQLFPEGKLIATFSSSNINSTNVALTNAYATARVKLQIANIRLMRSTAPVMDWLAV